MGAAVSPIHSAFCALHTIITIKQQQTACGSSCNTRKPFCAAIFTEKLLGGIIQMELMSVWARRQLYEQPEDENAQLFTREGGDHSAKLTERTGMTMQWLQTMRRLHCMAAAPHFLKKVVWDLWKLVKNKWCYTWTCLEPANKTKNS